MGYPVILALERLGVTQEFQANLGYVETMLQYTKTNNNTHTKYLYANFESLPEFTFVFQHVISLTREIHFTQPIIIFVA